MSATIAISGHATRRCAQRRISLDQMGLVQRYGRRYYGHGAVHYFFGRQETERLGASLGRVVDRLEGIVVVAAPDGFVLTAYRNHDATRHLRRKTR